MHGLRTTVLFSALIIGLWRTVLASEYLEQLTLRPLPPAALSASFHFHSNTSRDEFEQDNFISFPRSLGQILQHAHTRELHLRFTSGRWNDEQWGKRPWDGFKEGGTGVELWAWLEASTDDEAYSYWLTLTNALSGLFCASINFIDATRTLRPALTFAPLGQYPNNSAQSLQLLHGVLPAEVVCTENLTPFLKLLPCKGKAGIASLLDGHKLFDSLWQTMSIDIQPTCHQETASCTMEIDQTIDIVLDINKSQRPHDSPIPRPVAIEHLTCNMSKQYGAHSDSCFPVPGPLFPSFSISEIFGKSIRGACPLVQNSSLRKDEVCVDHSHTVVVNSSKQSMEHVYDSIECYKLRDSEFELEVQNVEDPKPVETTSFRTQRSLAGRGQQFGGFRSTFTNPSDVDSVRLEYLEPAPWFTKSFLHTMRAQVTSSDGVVSTVDIDDVVSGLYYRPGIDRVRGSHLEMKIIVPRASTLTLSYDLEKSVLRYSEYPPDANRGFNAASAIVAVLRNLKDDVLAPSYMRSASLLLYLPTPDFSMPYNVIILSSTVIALAFGSIFNFLIRRFVVVEEVAVCGLKDKHFKIGSFKNTLRKLQLW